MALLKCSVCSKEFEAKNYWQKYCSNLCRLAAWALRRHTSENLQKLIQKNK